MAILTIRTTTTLEVETIPIAQLIADLLRKEKDGSGLVVERSIYDLGVDVETTLDEVVVT